MDNDRVLLAKAHAPLADAARGNPRALLALAANAQRDGALQRCHELVQEALALGSDDPEIAAAARTIMGQAVPAWHFPMMRDDIRNQAFQDAIERAVAPGMKVLDIGSGSGLLAMMAARAGAGEVHSCELNPVIAATAREIVARNGYADTITVHARNSAKLDAEADMGGPADLVISEIIGKDLVCEAVLPSMRDAVRRLAKPGAQVIPRRGEIRVALAHYAKLEALSVDNVCGFDLTPFNRLRRARIDVQARDPALTLRGEPAVLFDFDFASADPHPDRSALNLVASGGTANGVVQWFRLQMDEAGRFENPPGEDSSRSWALVFFPFDQPLELEPGEQVAVAAKVVNNLLRVWQA